MTVFINYKFTQVCIPKNGSVYLAYQVPIKSPKIADLDGLQMLNNLQNTLPPQCPIPLVPWFGN